jgi:hypothetical protein
MITQMEKLMTSLKTIKSIAESGHEIAVDEISRMQFEQIIRALGDFQEWKARVDEIKEE